MLRPLGRLALAVASLWLFGCVSGAAEDGPIGPASGGTAGSVGSGTSGSQGQPLAGAGTGGSSGGQASGGSSGTAPTAGSNNGSAGAMACTSYTDDAAWSLMVHIKNQKSTTIYVGQDMPGCDAQPLFQVEDGSRQMLTGLGSCRSSCTQVMTSGPVSCPAVCATPMTVTLAPGQTIDIPWNGQFAVPETLPTECLQGGQQGPAACVRAQQVKPGLFTFTAKAGTQLTCSAPGTCVCSPNATGGCMTPSSTMSGTIITTQFIIALEPGEPGGKVGDFQYLGLVFKD